MLRLAWLGTLLVLPVAALAQDWYPKHNFSFGLGAGIPRADLERAFDPKIGLTVGYGYRFHRNFQLDGGLDVIFGAGNVRDVVDTGIAGFRRVRDYQYFVPLGGRAILPIFGERVLLFGGGGGAYMRYQEQISQPSNFYRIECPLCTSRSGWGYYATAGITIALDQGQHFRLTFAPKVYRGHTNGEPLGDIPAIRTRDEWVNVMASFSFSF